jgi:hypothetical protein
MPDQLRHPEPRHYRVIGGPLGRGRIVEALPYTGVNTVDLLAWMGDEIDVELRPGIGIAVHLAGSAVALVAVPGDWMVHDGDLYRPLTPRQVAQWLRPPYNWCANGADDTVRRSGTGLPRP